MQEIKIDNLTLSANTENVFDDEVAYLLIYVFQGGQFIASSRSYECGHIDIDNRWSFVEKILNKYADAVRNNKYTIIDNANEIYITN